VVDTVWVWDVQLSQFSKKSFVPDSVESFGEIQSNDDKMSLVNTSWSVAEYALEIEFETTLSGVGILLALSLCDHTKFQPNDSQTDVGTQWLVEQAYFHTGDSESGSPDSYSSFLVYRA